MIQFKEAQSSDLNSKHQVIAYIGASILDANAEIPDGIIVIKNSEISLCGPRKVIESKIPADALKIDCTGLLITPGLINAHTHCGLSYLRSLGHGQKQMIETLFFKTETKLNESLVESLCYSDLLTGLRSGVTCFVDHYYFHRGTARAIDQFGLRGVVSDTLLDLSGPFHGWEPWKKFQESLQNWNFSDRITPCIGPHASNTTSPKMFKELADFAKANQLPLHFHLSQTKHEWENSIKTYGKSPVAHAASLGALSPKSQAVHLLYVDDQDLKILKDTGTRVGFCPSSQIMYEKLAPIDRFIESGLHWTLGTDCAASNDLADLHAEMKVSALMALDRGVSQTGLAQSIFRSATVEAAECFGLKTGLLKDGYLADLVFHDLGLQALPAEKLYETFVFSLNSQQIRAVMVDGEFLLWNGEPTRLNLPPLTAAYRAAVTEMHKSMGPR
jgi:5-methylthioadenosine/S-adenosylhomocysteine deaminase